jgi:ribonuclease Z
MPALQEEMAQQQQFEATIHLKANIPHVIMLGTGSMLPSKHRNVSSCFVQLKSDFALLIDCGEGTLMQLYERAVAEGRDKHAFEAQLLSIRCILITHFHSDHMLGLLAFLKEWDRISSRS